MLSRHPDLNPAVIREAEMLTDGVVTDALLRDAAIMRSLPLLVARCPVVAPSPDVLAARAVASAEAALRPARAAFEGACRGLGKANRRFTPPIWARGQPTPIPVERVRANQAAAMRWLNNRRALLRRAERDLAAARAALLALVS